MFFKKPKKEFSQQKKIYQRGFTLIEMALVLGIFGVLTAITIINYGSFDNKITLGNLSYEIAMQIREAQVFSLGVRGTEGNDFDTRYGVYFNKVAGNETDTFIYFADQNEDGICSLSSGSGSCDGCLQGSECLRVISLPRRMTIDSICLDQNGTLNPSDCATGQDNSITITFERPNPDALIKNLENDQLYNQALILVKSVDNYYKIIDVNSGGQISVKDYEPTAQ